MNYETIINDFLSGKKDLSGLKNHYNKRLFIESGILYSYGYHYPLGIFKSNILLINNSGYSTTTQKHISLLKRYADFKGVKSAFSDNDFNIPKTINNNNNTIKELNQKIKRAYKEHRKEQHRFNIKELQQQNKILKGFIPQITAEVI